MPKKTNILLFQRLIPHYRVALFKKLHEKPGIVVCHSRARKGASLKEQQELGFANEVLPRVYFGRSATAMKQCVIPVLRKYKPGVVITEFSLSYITFWGLFVLRKLFNYKLIVWTHGVKSKEMLQPFSSRQSKIQLWVYNRADAIILYSKKRKELLEQKIKNPEKLFLASNTLDTDTLNRIYSLLETKGKAAVKEELGFRNKFNFVFIGRLVPAKRLDLLLEAFSKISGKYDVALHIIGNGPEEEKVKRQTAEHENIFYHGPIHELEKSSTYLFASDLMVMPGYVGLSVVHAMAMGCPVLTCRQGPDGPYHSPEVEYIHDGINGLFCDNSAEGLKTAMSGLLNHPEKLTDMSGEAVKTIREEATLEHFVEGFEEAVGYVGFGDVPPAPTCSPQRSEGGKGRANTQIQQ